MNTEKALPRITPNKEVIKKEVKKFSTPEKTFNTKYEMQAYLIDSVSKNKRKEFNMNVKIS